MTQLLDLGGMDLLINTVTSGVTGPGTQPTVTGGSNTRNGAASAPASYLNGTWFTGGSSTTTKPQLLVEPTGASSAAWSTNGTGLGVNAASGFTGNLIDLQLNGAARFGVTSTGVVNAIGRFTANNTTAIPAGGSAILGFLATSTAGFGTFFGSGAPTITAAQGSLYLRSDGSSTSTRAYINTDGGTTWTAITTAA